jgi:hypothetical protein
MPHSIPHGDACFAYFNKVWGIPQENPERASVQIVWLTFQLASPLGRT